MNSNFPVYQPSPEKNSSDPVPAVYAYARSSAVCLNFSSNRRLDPTVTFDFARATSPRVYDWPNKVSFQLTHGELAECTAFLLFPWVTLQWTHGQGELAKTLTLSQQPGQLLFSLRVGPAQVNTPVIPRDQYFFRNRLLARLVSIQPDLPAELHLKSLELLARERAAPPIRPPAQ